MKSEFSAYILCGGKSSRMGEEKGLVEFCGKSFVQWVYEALQPLIARPTLVTKNTAYQTFQLDMIPDLIEDKGPVGGILTALTHCESDLAVVLSCDVLKINTLALTELLDTARRNPDLITFLSDGVRDYPLIGVYPKSTRSAFELAIAEGELRLRQVVSALPHHRIVLQDAEPLQNVNSKAELLALS
jgi:molybdopterin-guanine dinucleotide biosynthesis protein A